MHHMDKQYGDNVAKLSAYMDRLNDYLRWICIAQGPPARTANVSPTTTDHVPPPIANVSPSAANDTASTTATRLNRHQL